MSCSRKSAMRPVLLCLSCDSAASSVASSTCCQRARDDASGCFMWNSRKLERIKSELRVASYRRRFFLSSQFAQSPSSGVFSSTWMQWRRSASLSAAASYV